MAQFITLEGIEGSGKSVQLQCLEDVLCQREIPHRVTREPGGTRFGEELREILLRHDEIIRDPVAELLLYLADRYQHLKEVIEPGLAAGLHVISDRYHDATVAYQAYARGIGIERVSALATVLGIRPPDLTLVLDLEVGLGLHRARSRNKAQREELYGRFESETLDFHNRVRDAYHLLAAQEPDRVVLVDASGTIEHIHRHIVSLLDSRGVFGVQAVN